eukprot:9669162-Heterocapsa_arctica.AAC.1
MSPLLPLRSSLSRELSALPTSASDGGGRLKHRRARSGFSVDDSKVPPSWCVLPQHVAEHLQLGVVA